MNQRDDKRPYDEAYADDAPEGDMGSAAATAEAAPAPEDAAPDSEADILRSELKRLRAAKEQLETDLLDANDRHLRARAELDTMRRRMQGELALARDAGVDSAVRPALNVFDDLERALVAAEKTDDPASIVPGVRAVKEALLRNLAGLDIHLVGQPGDAFDPELHEALTAVPATGDKRPGTIDQVFEAGFVQGDRLVRVARVTVVADEDPS